MNARYGYPFVPLNDLETDNVDARLTILRASSKSWELITAKPWLALIHRITRAKGSHVLIQMWNGLNGCFLFLFYFSFFSFFRTNVLPSSNILLLLSWSRFPTLPLSFFANANARDILKTPLLLISSLSNLFIIRLINFWMYNVYVYT